MHDHYTIFSDNGDPICVAELHPIPQHDAARLDDLRAAIDAGSPFVMGGGTYVLADASNPEAIELEELFMDGDALGRSIVVVDGELLDRAIASGSLRLLYARSPSKLRGQEIVRATRLASNPGRISGRRRSGLPAPVAAAMAYAVELYVEQPRSSVYQAYKELQWRLEQHVPYHRSPSYATFLGAVRARQDEEAARRNPS